MRARPRRRGFSSSRGKAPSAGPRSDARATSSKPRCSPWSTRWSTSSPDALSKSREAARQEIPEPLRRDVRLLGRLLGDVIADYGGAKLLRDVEQLRALVIRGRDDGRYERAAEKLAASWQLERAELVARAFACYFHLANLAEEHHRARVLRERDRGPAPQPESLAATINELRPKLGRKRLAKLVANLEIHPVFTAHPTEARRRAVVTAIRRVGEQLERLEDPRISDFERSDAEHRLAEEVDGLWRTALLRSSHVQPLDEVRSFMAVFDGTVFRVVPELMRSLDTALGTPAPPFLRFGSWIGGDRDGNPAVTAQVTSDTMAIHSEHALLALETVANRVGRALTVDSETTPPSRAVRRRIAEPTTEPHRQFLLQVARRLRATRLLEQPLAYASAAELVDDLRAVRDSLAAAGATRLAMGEIQRLLWQAETFGFHLAELEIRQHSKVHERALAEIRAGTPLSDLSRDVLDTLDVMASLQARFGVDCCRRYVVSFTRTAADVAAVYQLARHARGKKAPVIDVVPLFETLDDLAHATQVLDQMLELAPVRKRLGVERRLEVMLGYSDSAKEAGPLSATLALHDAQAALTAWAAKNRVQLTLFHGRGGALGRLRIASRPTRRAGGRRLEDLRAIPWVFAWSQMRLNLPGWYGMGSGLSAAPLRGLRRAYADWPLFNAMIDNSEMSLAKTDRRIAELYLALGGRPDLSTLVLDEYDLTMETILAVTGHRRLLEDRRVLSWAIELRNPYVDALSHLQLRALRALRHPKTSRPDRKRAERVFQLTVNGVAAGLQNTG